MQERPAPRHSWLCRSTTTGRVQSRLCKQQTAKMARTHAHTRRAALLVLLGSCSVQSWTHGVLRRRPAAARTTATMTTSSGVAASLQNTAFRDAGVPRASLPPEELVPLLMRALECNDEPTRDAGLRAMWAFSSDVTRFVFDNNATDFVESAHETAAQASAIPLARAWMHVRQARAKRLHRYCLVTRGQRRKKAPLPGVRPLTFQRLSLPSPSIVRSSRRPSRETSPPLPPSPPLPSPPPPPRSSRLRSTAWR